MEEIYKKKYLLLMHLKHMEIGHEHSENTGNFILTRTWPPCTGKMEKVLEKSERQKKWEPWPFTPSDGKREPKYRFRVLLIDIN